MLLQYCQLISSEMYGCWLIANANQMSYSPMVLLDMGLSPKGARFPGTISA